MSDIILYNAHILSMDPNISNAQLVAVKNGKIIAVTSNDALNDLKEKHTETIDCKGKTLLPGFIDPHCHLYAFGEKLVSLDLSPQNNIHSISDIKAKIKGSASKCPSGTWIRGKGYNEFYLAENRHPTKNDLDEAAPHHPVKLTHRSGHAHVLNSMAMDLAGIAMHTPEPPGGIIERDIHTGEPDGLLYEMGDFLSDHIPPLNSRELDRGIISANRELISQGITTIQDASYSNTIERMNQISSWYQSGLIRPETNVMLGAKSFDEYIRSTSETRPVMNQFKPKGIKIIIDETSGTLHPCQSELNEMVLSIHRAGFQAAIHAIEETAVESASIAIAHALQKLPKKNHRHRIEHCSVCPAPLANRLSMLGIIVVTQPLFIYYNGDRYLKTVPENQRNHLYPIARLIKSGVSVAASSDTPIVPGNPITGIYSAITRKTDTGNVVLPEEKISTDQALRMHTIHAAHAIFEEKSKGSITPGKQADMVLLNADIASLSKEEIKDCKVEMTIINGEVVWKYSVSY